MSTSSSSFSDVSSSWSTCSGSSDISGDEQMSIIDYENNPNIDTNYENSYAEINNNIPLSNIETPKCFTVDLPQGKKHFITWKTEQLCTYYIPHRYLPFAYTQISYIALCMHT